MNESLRHLTEQSAIELLDGLDTEAVEHFGRPLRDHLIGTWRILRNWDEPDHVCLAGLFHSVYGTGTFRTAVVPHAERTRVRNCIGADAELLVYLFGMSDRRRLLLENESPPFQWVDHRTGDAARLEVTCLRQLVTLDVANFLEQLAARPGMPSDMIQEMQFRFVTASNWMSRGAIRACQAALPNWPAKSGGEVGGGTAGG